MKIKYILTLFLLIVLTGCSFIKPENNSNDKDNNKVKTSDALEFAKSSKGSIFQLNNKKYKLLKKYTNGSSNNQGLTMVNNKDFKTNFSYMLIEETSSKKKYLSYFGEIKNDTDVTVEFLNYVHFITDTGEQLKSEAGLNSGPLAKNYHAKTKGKGFSMVPIDYQDNLPKEIAVTIEPPHDNHSMSPYGNEIYLKLSENGEKLKSKIKPLVTVSNENKTLNEKTTNSKISSKNYKMDKSENDDELSEEVLIPPSEYNYFVDEYNKLVTPDKQMNHVTRDVTIKEYDDIYYRWEKVHEQKMAQEEAEFQRQMREEDAEFERQMKKEQAKMDREDTELERQLEEDSSY